MGRSRAASSASDPSATDAERAVQLAVAYLARQACTAQQLSAYLTRKGVADEAIAPTVAHCRARGYLDDRAYAQRWAEARLAKYPMGAARLQDELRRKGIEESTLAALLTALYPPRQERVLAERLVAAAARRRGEMSVRKLALLLGQRGFDEDVIESVLASRTDD